MEIEDNDSGLVIKRTITKEFDWKIPNFKDAMPHQHKDDLHGTTFRFCDRTWHLRLYPRTHNFIPCLHMDGNYPGPPLKVYYSFGLRLASGKVDWRMSVVAKFGPNTGTVVIKRGVFLNRQELSFRTFDLAPNNALTLVCNLMANETMPITDFQGLGDQLQNRYLYESGCEVMFTFKLRADRGIRMSRSHLFSARPVQISTTYSRIDCLPQAFKQFMHYLHGGEFSQLSLQEAFDLYRLSLFYDIRALRERCVDIIMNSMDPMEACDVILFAKHFSEIRLLEVASQYLVRHYREVLSSDRWVRFVKEHPEEAYRLFILISMRF